MMRNGSGSERGGKISSLAKVQTELFERFQEANKRWRDRVEAEARLTSEFVSKLSSARSIPDAMTAYQDWGTRRFDMMAKDAKHVLDDAQRFMLAGAHMLTNGFASKSIGISS